MNWIDLMYGFLIFCGVGLVGLLIATGIAMVSQPREWWRNRK